MSYLFKFYYQQVVNMKNNKQQSAKELTVRFLVLHFLFFTDCYKPPGTTANHYIHIFPSKTLNSGFNLRIVTFFK